MAQNCPHRLVNTHSKCTRRTRKRIRETQNNHCIYASIPNAAKGVCKKGGCIGPISGCIISSKKFESTPSVPRLGLELNKSKSSSNYGNMGSDIKIGGGKTG